MPKHDVWITLPSKPLKNVDATIEVWSAGEKLGELRISRGTADWRPAGKQNWAGISWERFRDLLNDEWRRRYED